MFTLAEKSTIVAEYSTSLHDSSSLRAIIQSCEANWGRLTRDSADERGTNRGRRSEDRAGRDGETIGTRVSPEVNASHSPKFLGQPELCGPRDPSKSRCRWVVVAPVTSIPTEALQSKRPMPKTRHACTRGLSLSRSLTARTRAELRNERRVNRDVSS